MSIEGNLYTGIKIATIGALMAGCTSPNIITPEPTRYIEPTSTGTPFPTAEQLIARSIATMIKITETPKPTAVSTETPVRSATPKELVALADANIMAAGDSFLAITRIPDYLNEELEKRGVNFKLVGDRTTTGNSVPSEGHGGFDSKMFMRQLLEGKVWTELNGKQTKNNLSQHVPDIVVFYLGLNDACNGAAGNFEPAKPYKEHMTAIVEYLRSKNPHVKILLVQLVPSLDKGCNNNIPKINSKNIEISAELNTKESPVVTTQDLSGTWQLKDFADNFHPSVSGQQKIASEIAEALVENQFVQVPVLATPTP